MATAAEIARMEARRDELRRQIKGGIADRRELHAALAEILALDRKLATVREAAYGAAA